MVISGCGWANTEQPAAVKEQYFEVVIRMIVLLGSWRPKAWSPRNPSYHHHHHWPWEIFATITRSVPSSRALLNQRNAPVHFMVGTQFWVHAFFVGTGQIPPRKNPHVRHQGAQRSVESVAISVSHSPGCSLLPTFAQPNPDIHEIWHSSVMHT